MALADPLFFFARETASGRVKNYENYKISGQIQFGHRVRPSDYPIGDELFVAFKEYVNSNTNWKISDSRLEAEKAFIKTRLRFNLAAAAFGSVAANQITVEADLQVAKALEALPRAGQLALTARKTLQNKR
jgi:hypothetical protein